MVYNPLVFKKIAESVFLRKKQMNLSVRVKIPSAEKS